MKSKAKKDEELPDFTMPRCTKCDIEAEYETDDNSACGDPECCGAYEEWTIIKCPNCGITQSLRD